MKKLLIAAAVAGSVLTASVFAGPTDGVINMQTIFTQSKQLKAASVAMKTKFAPMQKHCQTLATTLQADMKHLQKNSATMSKSALATAQKKIQGEQQQVQQCQMGLQQQAMAGQQAAMKSFMATLKAATATVAKKKGMSMVFPNNAVIYSTAGMDITQDVLAQINK